MDAYVDSFQSQGGSMIMIGKGNRSPAVTKACKKYGGFYLGSIGGVAATLSSNSIKKVEVLDMEELGMEAVWKIEVEDFPAFVIVDNKGNDFFKSWVPGAGHVAEEDSEFDEASCIFFGLDTDSSGRIDVTELAKGLRISEADACQLLSVYDTDHSMSLDIKEFELLLFQQHDFVLNAQKKAKEKAKA